MAKKIAEKERISENEMPLENERSLNYQNASLNSCPTPNGILVIIGGAEEKSLDHSEGEEAFQKRLEVLKTFVDLINKENSIVEVITTASSLPEEYYNDYKEAFTSLGVTNVGHIHHTERKQLLEDDLSSRIENADALFFTGGDQLLLTSLYGGTAFLTAIKNKYINQGLIIGGTSAGAMAMSTPMIYAGNKSVQQIAGEVKITTGLQFLQDVCIDTHFIDRSRFVRLAQVIATNPTTVGIGIEEDTAIIVRNGLQAEVLGSGVVTVIEGFDIESTNIVQFSKEVAISIKNLRVNLLGRGNKFEIPLMNPPHK